MIDLLAGIICGVLVTLAVVTMNAHVPRRPRNPFRGSLQTQDFEKRRQILRRLVNRFGYGHDPKRN